MEDDAVGKAYDSRLMRRLIGYMLPYWRTVTLSLAFLFVNGALQVAGPYLTKTAIDRYLVPDGARQPAAFESLLPLDPQTGLAWIAALFLAAVAGALLFEFGQLYLMQRAGQFAMFDLRRELVAYLQRLDIAYFDRNPSGRLVTRVTTDVDVLNELFASGLVTIAADLLTISFVLAVMFGLSAKLTLLLLGVMPFVILATAIFRRSVMQSYRRIRAAIARINAYLAEHVNGIAVLQLFNREQPSREAFAAINRDHMIAFKDSIFAYGWFYPVIEFLSMLAIALLLAVSSIQIESGGLTLGVLVAFLQYGLRFFRPIQDLSEKYNVLQSAMAAAERIFKLLDTSWEIRSPANPTPAPEGSLSIEFDRVWFAYKDENWVLRDVSFRAEAGDTLAVVGHTGAGKTTLANLLLRFYDAQRGSIRVGGVDVRHWRLDELRRRFGAVLQDSHLFTGTIESNIRLGTRGIGESRVIEAAAQVNLRGTLERLPEGLRHAVRERGQGLSTGQKQLIGFARALAHDPRILILDEATSSVDTDTELRVREALGQLVKGRTSLIIAHRLSTIQQATRILVMHKGALRESGTHQELLALRGIYWKLYQLQFRDQEPGRERKLA